jgi:hypothetical protein
MYDLESGCHQASVEAQGRYICVGYFAEPMEAARARDIGMIRMIGFESAKTRLCLDIINYETIDVIELRAYDELLENSGAELVELSDDSANMFGYRWLNGTPLSTAGTSSKVPGNDGEMMASTRALPRSQVKKVTS